jgi:FixJ family two-component response regulator
MPGISGLDLQDSLAKRGIGLPVIVITGHGDVPMAIRAMKAGAMDFIEKPFSSRALLQRVREALARDARARQQRAQADAIVARMSQLSPREQEVLDYVVGGQYNKVIATRLGISISTVEAHRKKIMEKLEAESLSDLVRMVASCKERGGETAQAQ